MEDIQSRKMAMKAKTKKKTQKKMSTGLWLIGITTLGPDMTRKGQWP